MASVTNDRNLNLGVIGHLCFLTVLIGSHGDLETCGHSLEVFVSSYIAILQARSHRVHIEEGILPVLNVCAWRPIQRLVTLIANCWQV